MSGLAVLDICNRAITLQGGFNNNGLLTGSPPAFDGSPAGIACGVLYSGAVQTVARKFGWDFQRSIVALVNTQNAAPYGYSFEYAYPSMGIQVTQLLPSGLSPNNLNPLPIRWTVGNSISGLTAATGNINFAGNPSPGDTITLNGVSWEFVTSGATGNQTNIQGTTALTITILSGQLNASVNPSLSVATYLAIGNSGTSTLYITYGTLGTSGNFYTLAASAATPSGATLTGGTFGPGKVIWTNQAAASATYANQPPPSAWDAIFAETVVRLLASELNLALAGHPESSAQAFTQFGQFEQIGETRVDG